jgi:hypothetical protein
MVQGKIDQWCKFLQPCIDHSIIPYISQSCSTILIEKETIECILMELRKYDSNHLGSLSAVAFDAIV